MRKLQTAISSCALLPIALAGLSCGSGTPRLQSITVSPATANAQAYPDGHVPFLATGHYVDPTGTISPQPAQWGVCQNNAPTAAIKVTQTGVAQCAPGAKGKYAVFAYDFPSDTVNMANCNVLTACGGGCTIMGSAQLTCP